MLNTNKTDHLGSTSYLTDSAGSVCQFVCYTPYGEAFVDEHSTSYENPFKFSGKELDDITGLYDHGARSRDPRTTLWLGVDALWEKYPDFSPYSYCMANPVRLVDPDGQAVYGKQNEDGTMSYIVGENGDITAEGYTWIDDSYDCMDENGNYKQLPGGQSAQSSQTAQSTQPAPLAIENSNANKPIEQNGGYLMTGGMNSTCGLGLKSKEVYGTIDCSDLPTSFGGAAAGSRSWRSLAESLYGFSLRIDNLLSASGCYDENPIPQIDDDVKHRIKPYLTKDTIREIIPVSHTKNYYGYSSTSYTYDTLFIEVHKLGSIETKRDTLNKK